MRHRRLPALVLGLLACLLLAACGEREEPTGSTGAPDRVSVLLDYIPNVDHAGLYAAQGDGHFERAKLEVELESPPTPRTSSTSSSRAAPISRSPTSPTCCSPASRG